MVHTYIDSVVEDGGTFRGVTGIITKDAERAFMEILVARLQYCPIAKKWFMSTRPGYVLGERATRQIAAMLVVKNRETALKAKSSRG